VSMKRNPQIETMRERLQSYLNDAREDIVLVVLRRVIEDPLKPRNEMGGFRLNPILLLLAVLITFSVGTFLFFSFVNP
jgi:hypothetical protein